MLSHILHWIHELTYLSIVSIGIYGIFNAILLWRQLKRRAFARPEHAEEFMNQLRENFDAHDFEAADAICASPKYWYNGVSVLTRVIIAKRRQSLSRIKQTIHARFSRDILTHMDTLIAGVAIVVKTAPMLGLFGTVIGMIGAFTRIASNKTPSPQELMADMSVALNATAMGLICAIPLMLTVNYFQQKVKRFEEVTMDQVQGVLDDIEAAATAKARAAEAVAR